MASLIEVRAQAEALGITAIEAKKYGDIRHQRTWSLAIEHRQLSADAPAETAPPSAVPLRDEWELTPTQEPACATAELETASPLSPLNKLSSRSQQAGDRPAKPINKIRNLASQPQGWEKVVKTHLKALQTAATSQTNQPRQPIRNWRCPECQGEADFTCYLCGNAGHVDDTSATAWTLAYMELLGCSAEEIQPFRSYFLGANNTLQFNLQVCQTIKESVLILARTDKWVAQNSGSSVLSMLNYQ